MGPMQWYRPSRCNTLYLCQIAADGTFNSGPQGWDAQKTGTGTYRVTHNLTTLAYAAIPTPLNADFKINASVQSETANDLTVTTFNNGTAADAQFQLLVMTTQ